MKQPINEIKRMQQLAGLVKESQVNELIRFFDDEGNPIQDEEGKPGITVKPEKILYQKGDIKLIRTDKGDYAIETEAATYPNLDLETAANFYFKLTKGVR
jgi:hypothetical protein